MRRSTLWRFLAVALPTLGALVAPLPAVDLAYQLRAGAEILDSGAIPATDTWTFTVAGTPWLDQQWGAQVLLTLAYRLGGWTGLVLLRAGLVGLAFGLLLLVVRRRAPTLSATAATLLVIAAFLVSVTALALRPQLFAIDLFAAVLLLLAIRDIHPRAVWLIPIIALAWANLHGTFVLAPALCGLAWFADLAEMPASRGAARHRMLLVAVVATLATVVNPFGPAVWGYVANLTSNPSIAGRVSEWQPPSPLTVSGGLVWLSVVAVAAAAVAAVLAGARSRGRARAIGHAIGRPVGAVAWPGILTLLVFGGFALVSGRGTAWWPFVAVFVVAAWLSPAADPAATGPRVMAEGLAAERPTPPLLRRLNLVIAIILAVAGVALLPLWRPLGAVGVPQGTLSYAPQPIAAALAAMPRPIDSPGYRVWNPQVWGSWLEFAAPANRYALDSRIELFPAALWDAAAAGVGGQLGAITSFDPDIVVTDHTVDAALEAALQGDQAEWVRGPSACDASIWFRRATFPTFVASPQSTSVCQ